MTKVPGTEIYWIVLFISIAEMIIGFYQAIHYLERPSDKKRLSYLVLVWLLVGYNLSCGFFPDPNIPIPEVIQVIIAFILGIATSIYFAYYLYTVYELNQIRKFFIWGSLYGLVLPFLIAIVIVYSFTVDLNFSRRLFVFIPGCYGLMATVVIGKAFLKRLRENQLSKFDAFSGYLAILCWIILPFILYAGDHQVLQHSVTNFGFLVLTISYIRKSVFVSQQEYEQLKRSEESLKQRVEEQTIHLERLIDQKRNMIINITHELKTPMTLQQNYLLTLEEKFGSNLELDNFQRNQAKITRDITNLFNLERLEHLENSDNIREKEYEKYAIDFSQVLQNTVDFFQPYAIKKQQNIQFDIAPRLVVNASLDALSCIINNLIENAIKYTQKGGNISVKLKQHHDLAELTITDNGIGIPPTFQTQIFEPYFQMKTVKRNIDGIGAGLALVKMHIDACNGKINISSELNTYTEFRVQFPLTNKPVQANFQYDNPQLFSYLDTNEYYIDDCIHDPIKPYIMIVEDNLELLSLMCSSLKKNYNIYTATNGNRAIEKLQNGIRVDLFVSDIMMDEMDGFEFYELVSVHPSFLHVPFIFLTAKADIESEMSGYKAGAISYIDKPLNISVLDLKIEANIQAFKKLRHALIDEQYIAKQLNLVNGDHKFKNHIHEYQLNEVLSKYDLTKQELRIARMMSMKMALADIAEELKISKNTLKSHSTNIYSKLNVKGKKELEILIKEQL